MNTLEQTIGNTPLVKLQRLGPDNGSEVWVKLEGNNPAGSVKDRAALSMIVEAEKRGEIQPGDVLIEATSGNTGIALAMIAALKGYRMKLLMPDNMSQERRAAMRAYGAELILVTKEQGMEGARDLALEMAQRGEGKLLDQYRMKAVGQELSPYHAPLPDRKSGSRPRGELPTLSPAWGPPAPLPGYRAFCANRVSRWLLSACSRKRAAVFPGSAAGQQSICRAFLTLRW